MERATTQRLSSAKDYYHSEQFYHDLEAAEQDIANGKGLRVSSKQELDALTIHRPSQYSPNVRSLR